MTKLKNVIIRDLEHENNLLKKEVSDLNICIDTLTDEYGIELVELEEHEKGCGQSISL